MTKNFKTVGGYTRLYPTKKKKRKKEKGREKKT
jgi:hypothetical protein